MLISYNWLQSYFDKKLPPPEKVGEVLTFAGFEVKSIEKKGGDAVLDIKVLADRACYALSHRGIAREVSAALDISLKRREEKPIEESVISDPNIRIDESTLCTKFVARRIEHIKVGPSPEWLRDYLEAIGQRSINNIVDITNFVMFDIGRPSHAFDADKVNGTLTVRRAKKGEVVVTLDNKQVELNNGELVMADGEGPVGLAGIKGGKRTEVDASTRNIILEAANWNPSYIRLTATSTGIKTEASRRFENRISPLLGEEGIDMVARLIAEVASTPKTRIGKRIALSHEKPEQKKLTVDPEHISQKLGIPVSEDVIVSALARLGIPCAKESSGLVATIPSERLDLAIPEDLVEEVARIAGYDKISAVLPPKAKEPVHIPKEFYYEWKIREILANAGFSEVMTSSFSEKGDIAIEKPLAEDKKYARPNLRNNFEKALKMNALNAPLFDMDETRIFEIGRVFPASEEHTALALGYAGPKKKKAGMLGAVIKDLSDMLGAEVKGESKDGVFECNLDKVLQGSTLYTRSNLVEKWDISISPAGAEKFTAFSPYPFIVRDVALFVSRETTAEDVRKIISENTSHRFDTDAPIADVLRLDLFDEFEKEGRKSFAFRMVFQAFDRTLTDEQVNDIMQEIYGALQAKGWKVR